MKINNIDFRDHVKNKKFLVRKLQNDEKEKKNLEFDDIKCRVDDLSVL